MTVKCMTFILSSHYVRHDLLFSAQVSQRGSNTFDVVAHGFVPSHSRHSLLRQKRETTEQEIPDELLVVQSIKISDKFGFRSSQLQSREGATSNLEKDLNSAVSPLLPLSFVLVIHLNKNISLISLC